MNPVVEQIKERLPITEVLGSYITLIPAGGQYKAKCPFHHERTASFSISPDRGLYYCFGCGAKGDIFTFVQQFEGVDFNGALSMLAQRAGVELKRTDRRADDLSLVYEFLEKTTLRYQNELQKDAEAMRYLRGRGISDETIRSFRIGYAPQQWRFVADACDSDAEKKIALRAGLIKGKSDPSQAGEEKGSPSTLYDRFRGRIMFPIADSSGRVIGFSGRAFPETADAPKYLNSPETELFQKSRVLYGFDKAKFHIKRTQFAILVEGQMDLLMSHQAGFRNTVATSGTAVSEQLSENEHANLVVLGRLSPHLFLAFDGDAAGQKALARAAMVAIALGMNPKVVPVPEGVDPADVLLAEGGERWKALLTSSQHFIAHQARKLALASHSPHVLVRSLRSEIFPFLAKVGSPIEQNLYMEMIGRELSLDPQTVQRELARFVAEQRTPKEALDVLRDDSKKQEEELTSEERFAAFIERFADEETLALRDAVARTSFDEVAIELPTFSSERRVFALSTVERDYAALRERERSDVAKELAEKAKASFFARLHAQLSAALRRAEQNGDDAGAGVLLGKLAALNQERHSATE